MSVQATKARSVYRRLLRELPSRSPSILADPSLIQKHIRSDFDQSMPTTASQQQQKSGEKASERRFAEAEQYIQYLRAQRTYTTLLERYNPGANMDEEEKVRLTARRVGMDLPVEFMKGGNPKKD